MAQKLDLLGLTDNEAEHVLQVVQRDMKLRKKEEKRLSELKHELDEEGSRCVLLSRQSCFNQRCCIRCCLPFTFLFNPKRQCLDCRYNICKACRVFNKQDKAWICSSCQKSRLLKTQSLEWFYTNVKQRFKRFGSAKVLKTLYRKNLAEHNVLSDLTEASAYEESVCNEGSICGSDSTFYRQSEEHSMAETLTVALYVAEEAVDEAISKAECDTDCQEKLIEAHYLRGHRGELIEELAQTIVQKIINRRKALTDMKENNNQDWPLQQKTDPHYLHHHHHHYPATCDQASSSLKLQSGLWRSHSAFSLLDYDSPALIQDCLQTCKKDGSESTISAWKSVDRLDNTVLQTPDRNWIALQSVQLSRRSLLTKRKSQVYSALEMESGVVSAYESKGSDKETKPEPDSSWGAAFREIHRNMTDTNLNLQDTLDRPTPLTNHQGSRDDLHSDSDGKWKPHKPLNSLFKRKVPVDVRQPSASRGTSIIDMNFNVEATSEEGDKASSLTAKPKVIQVRRSQRKGESKKEQVATLSVMDLKNPSPEAMRSDMEDEVMFKLQEFSCQTGDSTDKEEELDKDSGSSDDGKREERRQGSEETDGEDERLWKMNINLEEGRMVDDQEEEDLEIDEEMECRLYKLVAQSRLTYLSSTDDDLDKVDQSEGELDEDVNEDNNKQKKEEGRASKLCQLEKEVKATQFSSTEDELDRVGVDEKKTEEEGEGSNEELAVKVCKLANQLSATQFSSTEDEMDRAGRDEATLCKLKGRKAVQAAHLRDLTRLVSIAQFSSTEDELDKAENTKGENESSCEMEDMWDRAEEWREAFADLDVQMFDLKDEKEEMKSGNCSSLYNQIKTDDVEKVKTGIEDPQKRYCFEKTVAAKVTEDEIIEECVCGDKAENAKETQKRQELKLKSRAEEKNTDRIDLKTRTEQGHQTKAACLEETEKERIGESSDDHGNWEATAHSDDEDAQFDRIISSMLITLEDMQGEKLITAAESGRRNPELEDADGCLTVRRGSGFKYKVIDAQSTNASEESGSEKEHQRHGNDVNPESAGEEKFNGETFRKKEREELTSRTTNEQEEKEKYFMERRNVAQQVSERTEVDYDGTGGMVAEGQMKTTQEAAAEEECKSKETDEKCEESKEEDVADTEQRSTSSMQEGFLSPVEIQHRYSAVSLCSITTEVLKVLNATELLLQGAGEGDDARVATISLPPNTDTKKLDGQFSRLEENVYMAAGVVYSLEDELSDLEECARRTCTATSDMELSFLEEQVASTAARVQQSELQVCDISARICALKSAGLIVDTQSHLNKTRTTHVMPVTLDSTRQLRRRLPAPPVKEDKET